MVKSLNQAWFGVGGTLQAVGKIALFAMFCVTLSEVVGRAVWKPIPGAVEIISLLGGICLTLTVPRTSQRNAHVIVEMLIDRMPKAARVFVRGFTRCIALVFCVFIGMGMICVGTDYLATGEVSPGLRIPYYPLAFTMAGAFFVQVVQFCLDIILICRGEHE
jgi:TRAP-type C4-dicarboxylate transport system permease small subunit